MSDDQSEAAHDGDAGASETPTPGLPSTAEERPSGEDAGNDDVEPRSIPIGSPVDSETLAELKRRAEQPDEDVPPAQEDPC